jgi:hypothetical protein
MSSEERDRAARVALNQATFRSVNKGIAEKAEEVEVRESPLPFLCECDDRACRQFLSLTLVEYQDVRADPKQFMINPGHENGDERVLRVTDRYAVVMKQGEAGRIAADLDF